ncbi:hypothetical protein CPB83DRAFT_586745 [Crepidotus variabilis]|uniref:Uncharacterized protein n=1 Tax=Crepidotus variabilis TaxID=179855 RepID=A0A9P6EPR6_9AGAR|nr:hypothetical protein CPB83DRAFT_586745 [Crepidotus variabilis]
MDLHAHSSYGFMHSADSLALSIARIPPPTTRTFRVTVIFCWIYGFCCVISVLELVIICETTKKTLGKRISIRLYPA